MDGKNFHAKSGIYCYVETVYNADNPGPKSFISDHGKKNTCSLLCCHLHLFCSFPYKWNTINRRHKFLNVLVCLPKFCFYFPWFIQTVTQPTMYLAPVTVILSFILHPIVFQYTNCSILGPPGVSEVHPRSGGLCFDSHLCPN